MGKIAIRKNNLPSQAAL